MRLRSVFFPDPPRRIPHHRALGVALRTAHLMTFGALLGGHLFAVDASRLVPFLIATIASGLGLMALELVSTCAWLFMGKGLAVLLKLVVLLMVPLYWEYRLPLLLLTVAVASVGSHMPSRFRHSLVLPAMRQLGASRSREGCSGLGRAGSARIRSMSTIEHPSPVPRNSASPPSS